MHLFETGTARHLTAGHGALHTATVEARLDREIELALEERVREPRVRPAEKWNRTPFGVAKACV